MTRTAKTSRSPQAISGGRAFVVRGKVEVFPVDKPWVYVAVPKKITAETRHLADRGLVAVTATVGASTWKTSLMPMGDGTQFVPLPAYVRKRERVVVGERIVLSLVLRER